jgi:hypothetical protein
MIWDLEKDWQVIWGADIRDIWQSGISMAHSISNPRIELTPNLGLFDMRAEITAGVCYYCYYTQEIHLWVWLYSTWNRKAGFFGILYVFFLSLIILDPVSFKCLHPSLLMFYFLNILFSCLLLLFFPLSVLCFPVLRVSCRIEIDSLLAGRKLLLIVQLHLIL